MPVQEETDILKISGFVAKPDYYKKSRGEQFFFVNKRFIKSNYLQHAVISAYEELLPSDTYPLFVLFLEINPSRIDINVHPTKQEIKFDDEKLVYNYLKVTVRHALGSHNITPTLDFEQEPAFQSRPVKLSDFSANKERPASVDTYTRPQNTPTDAARQQDNLRNWQRLYEGLQLVEKGSAETAPEEESDALTLEAILGQKPVYEVQPGIEVASMDDESGSFSKGIKMPYQVHGQYIVSHIKSGFLLIDQQTASERILYERYLEALGNEPVATQKALFPTTLELAPADATLLRSMLDEVNLLGFEITEFGGNTFAIHGTPANLGGGQSEQLLIEQVLAQYKANLDLDLGTRENLARSMARSAAVRRGQVLSVTAMEDLIDQLFACSVPYAGPSGRKCFITFELDELQKRFNP